MDERFRILLEVLLRVGTIYFYSKIKSRVNYVVKNYKSFRHISASDKREDAALFLFIYIISGSTPVFVMNIFLLRISLLSFVVFNISENII